MEELAEVKYSRSRLYWITFAGGLLYVSSGCVIAWPSPVSGKLMKAGYTEDEVSWAAGCSELAATLGPVFAAASLHCLGRKPTALLTASIFALSSVILLSSLSLYAVFAARIIAGVALGASFCTMSAYVSEVSDDKVRGTIGAMNEVYITLGMLVQYCVGPWVGIRPLSGVSLSITLVFAVAFLFVPESPYHLMAKEQTVEARQILRWLRDNPPPHIIDREIAAIEKSLAEERGSNTKRSDIITKKGPAKALLISMLMMLCMEVSGSDIVANFTQPIFEMAKMSISASMSPILVGGVSLISAFFAAPLVFRLGLKNVFIISGTGMGVCMILLGVYFCLLTSGRDVSSYSFLPVVILIFYNSFFAVGLGPLPWTITAELLPINLKDVGSFIVGTFSWLLTFGFVKSFENFKNLVGPHAVFLFLGVATVLLMVAVWFVLPDTRGMTLNDIQAYLGGEKLSASDEGIAKAESLTAQERC